MELLEHLGLGFATALSPWNLLYCFVGCLLGTAVGVLPGLGPLATIAMLLPLTFSLPPVSALIMLAGIYYGAQYGGSTTAILINLPGESSSVVTAIDGYQMAKKGRAGAGAGDGRPGLVLRRHGRDHHPGAVRPAAGRRGAPVRPGRILLADGAGPGGLGGPGLGSLLKAFTMIVLRPAAGPGRHRRRDRHRSASPSTCRSSPTGSTSWRSAWACSGWARSSAISSTSTRRSVMVKQRQRAVAQQGRLQADHRPGPARHRPGLGAGHPARRRGHAGLASPPTRWKSGCRPTGPSSARAPSRAWRHRNSPTMPGRRPRSSRC